MKNVVIVLCLLIVSLHGFSQSQSQKYKEIKAILQNQGFSISVEQYADLAQGGTAHHDKEFYKDTEYVIIGMSDDDDVNDVDITLQSMSGEEYSKDTDSSSLALVRFEPSFSRKMRVIIKNYDSDTPSYKSRCRILIGYK